MPFFISHFTLLTSIFKRDWDQHTLLHTKHYHHAPKGHEYLSCGRGPGVITPGEVAIQAIDDINEANGVLEQTAESR